VTTTSLRRVVVSACRLKITTRLVDDRALQFIHQQVESRYPSRPSEKDCVGRVECDLPSFGDLGFYAGATSLEVNVYYPVGPVLFLISVFKALHRPFICLFSSSRGLNNRQSHLCDQPIRDLSAFSVFPLQLFI